MSETRKAAIVAGVCWALSLPLIEAAAYCDTGIASNMFGWGAIWVFSMGVFAAATAMVLGNDA
ncbi:hypothetical protein ACFFGF_04815 [Asaia lannensis]|uniref:Uncharacterized protein n=1 Tax=Asaia lannensis NBRC 102526 TaxID=1307926 RepID=A0ABT1CKW9_9PROT|nr:hypothetical protein [Asaia lannensis]MCO6160664.1 hypothetical protein [Asaia lannensis NBRC 102526]GBR02052.1 hypothetical protein AA102526_2700 [Asaia lannensis NBRC 102526]